MGYITHHLPCLLKDSMRVKVSHQTLVPSLDPEDEGIPERLGGSDDKISGVLSQGGIQRP